MPRSSWPVNQLFNWSANQIESKMISPYSGLSSQLQNSKKGFTPAKAGVQKFSKRLDSRFHGNEIPQVLQSASSWNKPRFCVEEE
jgi:hypothetical protein